MSRSCKLELARARGNQRTPGFNLNGNMFIASTHASPIGLLTLAPLALAGSISTFTACASPTPNASQYPESSLH
jgi:hypothetical protein